MNKFGTLTSTANALTCLVLLLFSTYPSKAQNNELIVPRSKAAVEKALRGMQASMAGRLPTLAGFADTGDRPVDRFQRGYYQCNVQVSSTASGGTLVRFSAKITAWYADPVPSRSRYQVLPSNGRLEADLLGALADALGGAAPAPAATTGMSTAPNPSQRTPVTSSQAARNPLSKSLARIAADQKQISSSREGEAADKHLQDLESEARNLEQILQNQAHPTNLIAVKNARTPVVASPRLDAKILFYASAHDEFEILDMNSDWVHVRISGLSRGWIRRSSLEMPGQPTDLDAAPLSNSSSAAPFSISSEEIAPFPGTWEPLRGKIVKIISVTSESTSSSAQMKLQFAKSLLEERYTELAQTSPNLAGVLLIFDSVDGGMIAATLPTVEHLMAGTLDDAALWRQCFFDPPETFAVAASR